MPKKKQKEQMERFWHKAKPIVRKVFLAIFCIGAILLMLFGLIGNGVFEKPAEAIIMLLK